jgi:hypothetical protein
VFVVSNPDASQLSYTPILPSCQNSFSYYPHHRRDQSKHIQYTRLARSTLVPPRNVYPWPNKWCKDFSCVLISRLLSAVIPSLNQCPSLFILFRISSLLFFRPSARAIGIFATPAIDDPHKVVKVIASEGKSGETKEISYSNCKIIGNGSFGVVFQAKLLGVPKDLEDIAIKKVLQDKRFKVRFGLVFLCATRFVH